MSEHKEVTAEEFFRESFKPDLASQQNWNSNFKHFNTFNMIEFAEAYAQQKIAALQSSQNISSEELSEKAAQHAREIYPMANEDDYPDNPNVNRLNNACVRAFVNGFDYARRLLSEPSPAQEVEKPDREAQEIFEIAESFMKRLLPPEEYGESYDAEALYHALEDLRDLAATPDLLKENQSLKDRVKELEQEAFFIKLHRDSAQEDASSLRAIIKSLEAENEELRKKGQWISVKERLPLTDDYVLITDGIEVWVGNYERSGYRGRSQWGQAFIGCSMVDVTEITHWQPLPSPSKPEN